MGDQLADLVFADATAERPLEITTQLALAAKREGCYSDQTAIALGEAGAFPNLPIKLSARQTRTRPCRTAQYRWKTAAPARKRVGSVTR